MKVKNAMKISQDHKFGEAFNTEIQHNKRIKK